MMARARRSLFLCIGSGAVALTLALLLSPRRMQTGAAAPANGLSVWETETDSPPPTSPLPIPPGAKPPLPPALPPPLPEAELLTETAPPPAIFLAVAPLPPPSLNGAEASAATLTLPIPAPDSLGESPRPPKTRQATAASTAATTAASAKENATPPSYDYAPEPPYPPTLRATQTEGCVRIRIAVDAAGQPTRVDIVKSSGYREFDGTARDWILRHWRFRPAHYRGIPTAGIVSTSIHFIPD